MKKIPTLFVRDYDNGGRVTNVVTPGTEWVLSGEGIATRKWDGLAIMIASGVLYKRYDAKAFTIDKQTGIKRVYDRKPPEGFIPLQEPEKIFCVSCHCVVQYPRYATQKFGIEKTISQQLLQDTHGKRPRISSKNQSESQLSSASLSTMSTNVYGSQRAEILHQPVCDEMAMGEQSKQTRQDIRARQEKENHKSQRLCIDLQTGTSEKRQERLCFGAQMDNGTTSWQDSDQTRNGSSQKQRQSGQSYRESGNSHACNPSRFGYLSTLSKSIQSSLILEYCCHKCTGLTTHVIPPDKNTGHWPGWVECKLPDDKLVIGIYNASPDSYPDGTYELCGPKIGTRHGANPEKLSENGLYRHGTPEYPDFPRTFDEIKAALETMDVEGVVWHNSDGEMVKIKSKDFGINR